MDWIMVNIPFIVVLILLVIKVIGATKRGIVKEICGLISIFVASVLVVLISFAVSGYFNQDRIKFVVAIILLILLLIVYRIIDIGLTTMKIISKVPVISFFDKILGIPFAIAEVVVAIWAVYSLMIILDMGIIETSVTNCINNNVMMKLLYEYNYLYPLISRWDGIIASWDVWKKLGM